MAAASGNPDETVDVVAAAASRPSKRNAINPSALSTRTFGLPKEVVLTASLVVVLKMQYGLDGASRRLEKVTEPLAASGLPSYERWLSSLEALGRAYDAAAHPGATGPQSKSALELTPAEMDALLSWAEQTLVLPNEARVHEWRRHEHTAAFLAFDEASAPRDEVTRARQEARERLMRSPLVAREACLAEAIKGLYAPLSEEAADAATEEPPGGSHVLATPSTSKLAPGQAYRVFSTPAPQPGSALATIMPKPSLRVEQLRELRQAQQASAERGAQRRGLPEELTLGLAIAAAAAAGCEVETMDRAVSLLEQALVSKLKREARGRK